MLIDTVHRTVRRQTPGGARGPSEKPKHCNFCGKSQYEVRKLIAGPSVYVCDECVGLCNNIIFEETEEQQPTEISISAEGVELQSRHILSALNKFPSDTPFFIRKLD
jgi:hypothetical protein